MESLSIKKCCDELLDLGKRNRLLYFTAQGPFLKAEYQEGISNLFQKVTEGSTLHLYPFDSIISTSGRTQVEFNGDEAIRNELLEAARKSYLSLSDGGKSFFVLPKKAPLARALRNLRSLSLSSQDERGINILFLALGMLRWKEKDDPLTEIRSPLLLVPVELIHNPNGNTYSLKEIEGEDALSNSTLVYKLKADYQLDFPEFDNEKDDYLSYLERVQEKINRYSGWVVEKNESYLGLFTFSKIDMYRDLKDNEKTVLENSTVRALFSGEPSAKADPDALTPSEITPEEIRPLHNVVDADSSQMEAIALSKKGVSFVLQGPPGTGKSQTITNIIAEALYDGKKVLFVSEKKAALDVVYTKLKNASLEDFCLSLHGSKANKKEVLSEIKRVLTAKKSKVSDSAKSKLNELSQEEQVLDDYAKELSVHWSPLGMTTQQILGMAASYDNVLAPTYLFDDIASKDSAFLKESMTLLKDVGPYLLSFGKVIEEYPYYGFKDLDCPYHDRVKFAEDLKVNLPKLLVLRNETSALASFFSIKSLPLADRDALYQEAEAFVHTSFLIPSLYQDPKRILSLAKEAEEKTDDAQLKYLALSKRYEDGVFSLNAASLLERFNKQYASAFRRLFSHAYHHEMKRLSVLKKEGKLSYSSAKKLFGELSLWKQAANEENEALSALHQTIDNEDIQENNIHVFTKEVETLSSLHGLIFPSLASLKSEALAALQKKVAEALKPSSDTSCIEMLAAYFDEKKYDVQSHPLEDMYQKFLSCQDRLADFTRYLKFFHILEEIEKKQLGSFLRLCLQSGYGLGKMDEALKKDFYLEWAHYVLEQSPTLREITREKHDETVAHFQEDDTDALKINQIQIAEKVSSLLPPLYDSTIGLVGDFLRDAEKKRNIPSIRRILWKYQELIQQVKPCFMMSPLTVSSFLTKDYHFDVVVFDEASQVFPWDAIGAIYRSKQAIIVGDNRQMPPTSFFLTNSLSEEDADSEDTSDVSSFESILDFCAAFPQRRLLWHYRSKSEDLISFSNRNFYQGSLITFPSSTKKKEGFGVDFRYVDNGIYSRSQHVNRNEAERVVDLIYEDIEKYPKDSLGVVAMNISQQEAIEDALEKRRMKEDRYHDFFENRDVEPFFVKNLETVQGDERDRIILSIGYGYDEKGTFYHNFGPLNRIGGERRLNVAITRAKYNVQIVSSIRSFDIKEERTTSLGAKLLKQYLSYAENPSLSDEVHLHDETDSPLESDIARSLSSLGYIFDTKVGSSEDKIDFGIRHPLKDAYVLALECDGPIYQDKKVARDRDRLREQVLRLQGFSFYRLWSNDWFLNRKREEEKLKEKIDQAVRDFDRRNKGIDIPLFVLPKKEEEEREPIDTSEILPEQTEKVKDFKVMENRSPIALSTLFATYQPCPITAMASSPIQNELEICQIIDLNLRNILLREQPMREDCLLRKLSKLTGRTKMTSTIKRCFDRVLSYRTYADLHSAQEDETKTYWFDDETLNHGLRLGGNRKFDEIPDAELENGLVVLLASLQPLSSVELMKSMSTLLGYSHLSGAMKVRFDRLLASLLHCERIVHDSRDKLITKKQS